MSMVICHRLSYKELTGFYFDVKDDKIVDIIPQNVAAFIAARTHKLQLQPVCASCPINFLCLHGCLGAQYEYGEMMIPIKSVCKLFKRKVVFLVEKFNKIGVLDIAFREGYINDQLANIIRKVMCGEIDG